MNGTRLRALQFQIRNIQHVKSREIFQTWGKNKKEKTNSNPTLNSKHFQSKAFCIRDASSGKGQQGYVWFGVSARCTWSLSDSPPLQPSVCLCWDKAQDTEGPASAVPLSTLRGRNYLVGSMTPSHKLYHMLTCFIWDKVSLCSLAILGLLCGPGCPWTFLDSPAFASGCWD